MGFEQSSENPTNTIEEGSLKMEAPELILTPPSNQLPPNKSCSGKHSWDAFCRAVINDKKAGMNTTQIGQKYGISEASVYRRLHGTRGDTSVHWDTWQKVPFAKDLPISISDRRNKPHQTKSKMAESMTQSEEALMIKTLRDRLRALETESRQVERTLKALVDLVDLQKSLRNK